MPAPLFTLPALLLRFTPAGATHQPIPLVAGDIVLRGGLIFDAVGEGAVPNTGVIVRNGTVLEVGADLAERDLSAATLRQALTEWTRLFRRVRGSTAVMS